eukprot:2914792-Pyramimonas_sp.AAC.1
MTRHSISMQMKTAYEEFYRIHPQPGDIPANKVQAYIQKQLKVSNSMPCMASILYPRIAKWFPRCPMEFADRAFIRLHTLGAKLHGFVATAVLESLFNSWNTTR